ncbi:MAG: hypothetical protein SCALA701_24420 [Candidatus Scalindua sp.]|nr:MAG: hypothetical protein SCALA701_24420 [Candidatus Scalindua sp.]
MIETPGEYPINITNPRPGGGQSDAINLAVIKTTKTELPPEGSFGKRYEKLIPYDATIESYDPKRFSLITGNVKDRSQNPISEIIVSIHGHPEYGSVKTNNEGRFSIPVEGGGTMTIKYEKSGFITAHRKVSVPWNDIAITDTITMIAEDTLSTTVTFDGNPSTAVTHKSSPVTDGHGSRSATMVFRGDNRAFTIDESGNEVALTSITTRATEFDTPESMPARLPPNSAFTYCAELSVDGISSVRFEKPVSVYIDNFLGFQVGEVVPVGYYDRKRAVWVPSENGVVVMLLDTDNDGTIDALDSTGDSLPDDLNSNGSFRDEVLGLNDPTQYIPNNTYWRFETVHFSPWDCNWPFGPPADAVQPTPGGEPSVDQQKTASDDRDCTNSYIERKSRIFHEDIPIPGTDLSLHYASNRVMGYKSVVSIPVSGESVPTSLKGITVRMRVAGREFEQTVDPLPGQKVEFAWDGRDYLGNWLSGSIEAEVSIGFVYDGEYQRTNRFGYNGNGMITGVRARQEVTSWKRNRVKIYREGGIGTIAEGWTLSAHHSLVPYEPNTLYKGDGTTSKNSVHIMTTIAGNGQGSANFRGDYGGDGGPATEASLDNPSGVAMDTVGNIYIADMFNHRIRKVDTNGIITTIAGNGQLGNGGDGGPAIQANIANPRGVTLDLEGNIYFANNYTVHYSIKKIDITGIITTIAGNGQSGYSGDGGPATEASLGHTSDVAVDTVGNIYIAEPYNHRIRKVDINGIITTIAGSGQSGYSGDGGPATEASLNLPRGVAVDTVGNIYIADLYNHRIRKVDITGIITTVAGNGELGDDGDGGPAIDAKLTRPVAVTVDVSGNIYISQVVNERIRKVNTNGIITTIAGIGKRGYSGDGGPATEASLGAPGAVVIDSAGNIYIPDKNNHRIRKISLPGIFAGAITSGERTFMDENGLGYIINSTGLHISTMDLSTGNTLLTFSYDQDSKLAAITDPFDNRITLQRDSTGVPISITSPDGITTTLRVDVNNHLTDVTYPDDSTYSFTYTPDGLMLDEYDLNGNHFEHYYDEGGKVTDILDPEGGQWTYSRAVDSNGNIVTNILTGEDNLTTYEDRTESTGAYTSVKRDPTGALSSIFRSSDGLSETRELSCGMILDIRYDLDPEYRYKYPKESTRTIPGSLVQTTTKNRTYDDTDADDVVDKITDTVTVNGNEWISTNNTLTAMITNRSPLGRETTIKYNTTNLLTEEITVPGLFPTTFSYDTRGRLIGTTIGDRTTTRTYDGNGHLDFVITPDNKTLDYEFDIMGRPIQEERPDGTAISYGYDANGNMTLLVTPKEISHTFGYTGNDQRKEYAPPISGRYLYVFDKERKLKTLTYPSGSQILNTYTDGLLTETITPEGTIDFTYGCASLLSGVINGTEKITYTYDGSLLQADSRSGILTKTISYTYDNDLRLSSITYAGLTDILGYDDDGLLTSAGNYTITRNTDNGLPESVSDGVLTRTRSFNGYGEIDRYSHEVNGNNVYDISVTRDNAGRIIQKREVIGAETITWDYGYDALGRLIEVKENNSVVESYGYDANSNRTRETNTARGITDKAFDYTNEDHIIAAGNEVYVFDEDGFLTEKASVTGATSYHYSIRGGLLSVDLANGRSITYDHDPMGRRIAKRIDGIIIEKYLWADNTTLLAVYDGSDNLIERFDYADGRLPISMLRGGTPYYMIYDQVGSLRLIVDSSGNITKRIDYDSFGNIINDTTPGFTIPFGFAGGLHDRDTDLVRFGARDYDPTISRWTAKDPIDFVGGDVNLYGYVINNPVNLIDPEGLVVDNVIGQTAKSLSEKLINNKTNVSPGVRRVFGAGIGAGVTSGIGGFIVLGPPGAFAGFVIGSAGGMLTQIALEVVGFGQPIEDLAGDIMDYVHCPSRDKQEELQGLPGQGI